MDVTVNAVIFCELYLKNCQILQGCLCSMFTLYFCSLSFTNLSRSLTLFQGATPITTSSLWNQVLIKKENVFWNFCFKNNNYNNEKEVFLKLIKSRKSTPRHTSWDSGLWYFSIASPTCFAILWWSPSVTIHAPV